MAGIGIKNAKQLKLYVHVTMRVVLSLILLGLIGYNTTITKSNSGVWYTLLGNLTAYWFPSSQEEKEKDKDKEDKQKIVESS